MNRKRARPRLKGQDGVGRSPPPNPAEHPAERHTQEAHAVEPLNRPWRSAAPALAAMSVAALACTAVSLKNAVLTRRAERNLRARLSENPELESLTAAIRRNPGSRNDERARELASLAAAEMSPREQRILHRSLYQDSVHGRARYAVKLVTGERLNRPGQLPARDETRRP